MRQRQLCLQRGHTPRSMCVATKLYLPNGEIVMCIRRTRVRHRRAPHRDSLRKKKFTDKPCQRSPDRQAFRNERFDTLSRILARSHITEIAMRPQPGIGLSSDCGIGGPDGIGHLNGTRGAFADRLRTAQCRVNELRCVYGLVDQPAPIAIVASTGSPVSSSCITNFIGIRCVKRCKPPSIAQGPLASRAP
jgi:hypothetical protein